MLPANPTGNLMAKTLNAFPHLTTPRLRLRQFRASDAAAMHACFGDAETMRHWDSTLHVSLGETERSLRWMLKTTSPYDYLAWAVADAATDTCLGMVNYHDRAARYARMTIGYILNSAHHRKGLASEAVGAVLGHCFTTLGAHRVQAFIEPENLASLALVKKLGFHFEGGPLRDHLRVGDGYRSVMLYARLASDRQT